MNCFLERMFSGVSVVVVSVFVIQIGAVNRAIVLTAQRTTATVMADAMRVIVIVTKVTAACTAVM